MAESSGSAQDASAPLVLDEALEQMLQDDQEEWEYEYSTTETEAAQTYYLTLELSYPEFKGTSAKMNIHSRGGYYKNWQDTPGGADSANRSSGTVGSRGAGAGASGDAQMKEEDSSNDEMGQATAEPDDQDGGNMIDPALRSKGKEPARENIDLTRASTAREPTTEPATAGDLPPREEEPELRDEIQILELHSDHPLISYRGRLFEGEWAEIIGTEALLTQHDSTQPLPALRRVPGDIDLLGAVSSRIVTKEKIATARRQQEGEDGDDTLAATRAACNIHVPARGGGKDRTGARRQQARFLENLMALKRIKGQTDEVTVYALDGEGKDFDDKKDPDYKPRRKKAAPLTAEAEPEEVEAGGRGSGGVRRGRRRAAAAAAGGRRGKQRAVMPQTRSTSTPVRWEDLEEEEVDEGGTLDEAEDEEMSMG
ncbi:Transcription factor TFIIIC, tau55-related protein [Beauveria brongniartii RCEF 3172]|uniref:Transcription factor TFIIIC, tau55-related protein n=1 Tax=Beauveria brongniartii RCEF 3172 TaxID=1081107 RepID=A0A167KXR4_9HYPO|nr:Transcription factor TFIIIC, tau55-related protein [Beauveria brongniartii RCEF 3172]